MNLLMHSHRTLRTCAINTSRIPIPHLGQTLLLDYQQLWIYLVIIVMQNYHTKCKTGGGNQVSGQQEFPSGAPGVGHRPRETSCILSRDTEAGMMSRPVTLGKCHHNNIMNLGSHQGGMWLIMALFRMSSRGVGLSRSLPADVVSVIRSGGGPWQNSPHPKVDHYIGRPQSRNSPAVHGLPTPDSGQNSAHCGHIPVPMDSNLYSGRTLNTRSLDGTSQLKSL